MAPKAKAVATFKCVKIPAEVERPIETLSLPKAGGLEKDALRLLAEETFGADDAGLDVALQQKQTIEELAKQGLSPERIAEVMTQLMGNAELAGGGKARLGSNVEIVCVGLAKPNNHYRGVSLYCDGNAPYKKDLRANARATRLVQACGLNDRVVYGDCYLGRAHDDESQEWIRLDLDEQDCVFEGPQRALWIRDAALENAGKNMDKYTTSGSLHSYAAQQGINMSTGGAAAAPAPAPAAGPNSVFSAGSAAGGAAWSQTNEEVEVRYPLPPSLAAKDIEVVITRSTLRVCRKGYAGSPEGAAGAGGGVGGAKGGCGKEGCPCGADCGCGDGCQCATAATKCTDAGSEAASASEAGALMLGAEFLPWALQQPGGLRLFDSVIVGDSSWSKDGAELVVTLSKNNLAKWPSLFIES